MAKAIVLGGALAVLLGLAAANARQEQNSGPWGASQQVKTPETPAGLCNADAPAGSAEAGPAQTIQLSPPGQPPATLTPEEEALRDAAMDRSFLPTAPVPEDPNPSDQSGTVPPSETGC